MKGLDWSNELWVRLYRRDTPAWKRLRWEAQAVYVLLQRHLDRAGTLNLDGLLPFEAVAEQVGCPEDAAERALDKLARGGFLIYNKAEDLLVDPEFLERDEAAMSDAQRQRLSRERRRDRAKLSQIVTPESQNVTEPSRGVTPSHDVSLRDDPIRDDPIRDDPEDKDQPTAEPADAGSLPLDAELVLRENLFESYEGEDPLQNGQQQGGTGERPTAPDRQAAGFTEFWPRWPKKQAKKEALKAWRQTYGRRPELPDLLRTVDAWARAWRGTESKFIPNAATWLRADRWEDELPTRSATASKGAQVRRGAFSEQLFGEH